MQMDFPDYCIIKQRAVWWRCRIKNACLRFHYMARLSSRCNYGQKGKYVIIVFQLYPFVPKTFWGIPPESIQDDCYNLLRNDRHVNSGLPQWVEEVHAAETIQEKADRLTEIISHFWRHIMFGWYLKKAFRDHQLQEEYIFASQLNYTIVRPSAFTNGPITRNYPIGFSGDKKGLQLKISRADVADFMLGQLKSDQFIQKAVSISH